MEIDLQAPESLIDLLVDRGVANPVTPRAETARSGVSVASPELDTVTVTVEIETGQLSAGAGVVWEWYQAHGHDTPEPHRLSVHLRGGTRRSTQLRPGNGPANLDRVLTALADHELHGRPGAVQP